MKESNVRCPWANSDDIYVDYHDREWGVPVFDDRTLFEFLVLESAQAGLSWITILKKRDNYRNAYEGFDPERVASFDETTIRKLLQDPGIVRNRLKVKSSVSNARCFLNIQQEFGSFSDYLWSFTGNTPIVNSWRDLEQVPAHTELSERISRDMKKRGFSFVGSTIVYSFLQAVGVVNDHLTGCFRYQEIIDQYSIWQQ